MTPAARVQAAIEILDLVIEAARGNGPPADRIVTDWFRTRRYAGSGDRRAVRELAYAAIRACGEVPPSGRAAMLAVAREDDVLAALFDGSAHAPAPIAPGEPLAERGLVPRWLADLLEASDITGAEAEALLSRAPLDVRVNRLKAGRATIALPLAGEPTLAAQGLRLPAGTRVDQWDAWRDGSIEVQDTASQLACEVVVARPGETIVDLCAGAGGKTLALAAAMDGKGRLLACDTDRGRLSRLAPRAHRAGASLIETLLLDPGRERAALGGWEAAADAVLVDAPCSGSGTWRRNPEARWRLGPRDLDRLTTLQDRLLGLAAGLVRPGGRLVYATCSVLDAEGPDRVSAFLAAHPAFSADMVQLPAGLPRGSGIRLTPYRDGTDGFFVARLSRLC